MRNTKPKRPKNADKGIAVLLAMSVSLGFVGVVSQFDPEQANATPTDASATTAPVAATLPLVQRYEPEALVWLIHGSHLQTPLAYARMYVDCGLKYGVDPFLLAAQGKAESGYNPNARSGKANGIAQFTPATARAWGVNVWDPYSAIDGQARKMAAALAYHPDWGGAVLEYHSGRRVADRYRNGGPSARGVGPVGRRYTATVLEWTNQAKGWQA